MAVKKMGSFAANPPKKAKKAKGAKARKPRKASASKATGTGRKKKGTAASRSAAAKKAARTRKRNASAAPTTGRKRKVGAKTHTYRVFAESKVGKKTVRKRVGAIKVKSNNGDGKIDWKQFAVDAAIGGGAGLTLALVGKAFLDKQANNPSNAAAKAGSFYSKDAEGQALRAGAGGAIAAIAGAGIAFLGHKKKIRMAKRAGLAMAFVGTGLAIQGFFGKAISDQVAKLPGIKPGTSGLGAYVQATQMQGIHGMLLNGIDTNVGGAYLPGGGGNATMAGTSPFTETQFG